VRAIDPLQTLAARADSELGLLAREVQEKLKRALGSLEKTP
jgi:hypothetical protein